MSAMTSNGLLPLLTPPAPGLNLDASQQPRIIAASVVLIAISTVAVALRFLSRMVSKAGLWWDDWTMLAAMFFSWGAPICMIISAHYGFGRHAAAEGNFSARVQVASKWFKLFYIFETFYTFALATTKYSILLFYSRIFKTPGFKLSLWITTALVTAWFIAIEISVLAECIPIHSLWDFSPGRCINLHKFFEGSGIPNVFLNIIILLLPLPQIWTLQIDRTSKLALSGIFMLGSFVVIVSIIRIAVLAQVVQVDITWEYVNAGIWTAVEPCIGVASACLPIMRSLWIRSKGSNSTSRSARKSVPSIKSSKLTDKEIGSITSHSHLNELSTEGELPWGNHVSIYATHRRSASDEDNIRLKNLAIPANATRVRNQVSWHDDHKDSKRHSKNPAELSA